MRLIPNGINLWLIQTSEHAASSESLDGAKTDDVSEACGSKQRGMAHATEKAALGSFAPSLGYLMVALPMPMAMTLHTIITRATFGDQVKEAGAMARSGVNMQTLKRHLIFRFQPGSNQSS